MKKLISKGIILSIIFIMTQALNINAQIGPVVSISETPQSLPKTIQEFFKSYFPKEKAKKIEMKTLQNIYEIELNNGYEMKFNSNGGWIDIESPENDYISHDIIRELLPGAIYEYLKKKYVLNKVEEMDYNPVHGYKIEIDNANGLYFDLNGNECNKPEIFNNYD